MTNALPAQNAATPEEKQLALRKALESRTFSRSEQMRSFLKYVCEAEFRGESASINEYAIGTEVLHRPAGYSPAEDSSVRTRAYELRQKLERLYAEELPGESIRIVIPKGAYTPQFIEVGVGLARDVRLGFDQLALGVETPVAPISNLRSRPNLILLLAVTAAVSASAGYLSLALWGRPAALATSQPADVSRVPDPVVKQAWAPFVRANRQPLLVPATPLYMVLGPETHRAFETHTYPAPPEAYALFRRQRPLPPDGHLGMLLTGNALGFGTMNAVIVASDVIHDLGSAAEILPERPSMRPILHGRDVILFGAPVDSNLISDVLQKTPLTVDYDEDAKEFVIRDRVSKTSLLPEKIEGGEFSSVYGLVTVLNNRHSEHGNLGMVVFSGITSVGTHGAAEYFASPQSLKALLAIFNKAGVSKFPAAYQVVVKCKIEKLLLVSEEYQTHRVLQVE